MSDLDELDRNALQRCMDIAMRDPDRAEQLKEKLDAGESWADVAFTAAYGIQIRNLHLRPWQAPPCVADENDPKERDRQAQKLLRRMLAAGISRFEPEPLKPLRAAKRKKRRFRKRATWRVF
jgi:hypothetical protein